MKDSWRTRIALVFLSSLLTFIALELCYRVFLQRSFEKRKTSDRPHTYYLPSNTRSNQDYSYSKIKSKNTFRIAVIGDSFTFGDGVQLDDTFSKRLERMLRLENSSLSAEVLNFGVPGNATVHEVEVAKKAINDYHPDLLILQITLNDPEVAPFRQRAQAEINHALANPLFKYSHLLRYIAKRIYFSRSHKDYKEYYTQIFENKENWKLFQDSLLEIQELAQKNNTPLIAALFPLFYGQMSSDYPFTELHQKIRSLLRERKFPLIDLLPFYREIPANRLEIIPGKDGHPNEIAHRIAAEALYEWLKKRAYLPSELVVTKAVKKRRYAP
jgi:lysophospholipase L1-like esterase